MIKYNQPSNSFLEAVTEVVERSQEEESEDSKDDGNNEDPSSSYDSYVGLWSNSDDLLSGAMTVKFIRFDGKTARFTLGANSRNAARIATTDEIVADVEDDRIEFTYKDSFNNKGKGTITLNGDSIHLNAEITEMSDGGYGISGEQDMHKINE